MAVNEVVQTVFVAHEGCLDSRLKREGETTLEARNAQMFGQTRHIAGVQTDVCACATEIIYPSS